MGIATTIIGVIVVLALASVCIGALLWHRTSAQIVRRLGRPIGNEARLSSPVFSELELEGMPAPVSRYFRFALTEGQLFVRHARLDQAGEFALRPGQWRSFTASEIFSVGPPGFIWDATIHMAPLLPVRVRDGYVAGEGVMEARLLGLLPVANQRGTPEMASGELLRYLAEAVWLPTALLPSAGVSWTSVSESVARATLTDGRTTVSLDFSFDARGAIVGAGALRYRDVNGTPVLTPWVGRFGDYQRMSGMMIPMTGAVEWELPAGALPYWRGRIVAAEYLLAPVPASP